MVDSGGEPRSREKSRQKPGSIRHSIPKFQVLCLVPIAKVDGAELVVGARRVERVRCTKVGGNYGERRMRDRFERRRAIQERGSLKTLKGQIRNTGLWS